MEPFRTLIPLLGRVTRVVAPAFVVGKPPLVIHGFKDSHRCSRCVAHLLNLAKIVPRISEGAPVEVVVLVAQFWSQSLRWCSPTHESLRGIIDRVQVVVRVDIG
jgi:hypothetical protein